MLCLSVPVRRGVKSSRAVFHTIFPVSLQGSHCVGAVETFRNFILERPHVGEEGDTIMIREWCLQRLEKEGRREES